MGPVCPVCVFSHSAWCFCLTRELRLRKGRGQRTIKGSLEELCPSLRLCPTSFFTHSPLFLHLLSSTFDVSETNCHLQTDHMMLLSSAHRPNSLPAVPTGLIRGVCTCSLLLAHFSFSSHLISSDISTYHSSTLLFFSFIFISWRLITLQYCSSFCHTLT